MRDLIFVVFVALAAIFLTRAAHAQSAAAAQVCADILSQYGITPEGCDPQDPVVEAEPEPVAPVQTASFSSASDAGLEENNIFFRIGGDKLDRLAIQKLDTLSQVLNTSVLQDACLRLVGHSDSSGASETNRRMGQKRADVVAAYLRPRLNDPRRIAEIRSDGEDNLLPSERPESPRQRRVTIYARKCPKP